MSRKRVFLLFLAAAIGAAGTAGAAVQAEYFSFTSNFFADPVVTLPGAPLKTYEYNTGSKIVTMLQRQHQTEGNIDRNFDAGGDPPDEINGLNHTGSDYDQFAVRYRATLNVTTAGEYTFYAGSDDGIRVWINKPITDTPDIDQWVLRGFPTTLDQSAAKSLAAGDATYITVEYYENGSAARVLLQYSGPDTGGAVQTIPTSRLKLPSLTGLYGEYYNNSNNPLSGTPTFTRFDPVLDFYWYDNYGPNNYNVGAENFAVRWRGKIKGQGSGTHTFHLYSDDAAKLFVNGTDLTPGVNFPGSPVNSDTNSITLSSGRWYSIDIRMQEGAVTAYFQLTWKTPQNGTLHAIPENYLMPILNQAPTDIELSATSIDENVTTGTTLGTLSSTDADNPPSTDPIYKAHVYTEQSGGTGNSLFNISGGSVVTAEALNYESGSSYTYIVRSTDPTSVDPSPYREETFTITINNVNEAPTAVTLSNSSLTENTGANQVVGTLSTTDPDNPSAGQTFVYTKEAGLDGDLFTLESPNTLRLIPNPDFEAKSSYKVKIKSTDQGAPQSPANQSRTEELTINIVNVNEAPADIAISDAHVDENAGDNAVVGTLSTADPDNPGGGQTFVYSIVGGANAALFQISGNALQLKNSVNRESTPTLEVTLQSTDQGGPQTPPNLFTTKTFTIFVDNVNENPTEINLAPASVAENLAVGTTVGTFTTVDEDIGDTYTYTLVAGSGSADNGSFTIAGNELKTAAIFNYEIKSSYAIRVKSQDQGGLFMERELTIGVINVNETPSEIYASPTPITVYENAGPHAYVCTLTTSDPDNLYSPVQTFIYSIDTGLDGALFEIAGNELRLKNSVSYETKATLRVIVRTTDQGEPQSPPNLHRSNQLTVSVLNVNDAPSDIMLSNTTVLETPNPNALVGTFSAMDDDAGQTHTFAFVAGEGDTDNGAFTITPGNELRANAPLAAWQQNTYDIRVKTTDNGLPPANLEKTFTITVLDQLRPSVTVEQQSAEDPTKNLPIVFRITFSETVTGLEKTEIQFAGNPAIGAYDLTGDGPGPYYTAYTLTISALPGSCTLAPSVPENAAQDQGGGNGNFASTSSDGSVRYDITNPVVTVTPQKTNSTTPTIRGTATDNFGVTEVDVVVNTIPYEAVLPGDGTWSVTIPPANALVGVPPNTYEVEATAYDAVGNSASDNTTQELEVDSTAPTTVEAVSVQGPARTNAASVQFLIRFSLASGPVVQGDLALDASAGISGASIGAIAQNSLDPREWTVTVLTGTGNGTLSLDVVDGNGTIRDIYNRAVVSPFTTGETYTLDRSGPAITVAPLVINVAAPTITGSIADEALPITLDVSVNGQPCSNIQISGTEWSAQVAPPLAEGVYDVVAEAEDALGNTSADATDNELTIDLTPPAMAVDGPTPAETTGKAVTYTVTYSDVAVVTLDPSDVTLSSSGDVTADIAVSEAKADMTRVITLSHFQGEGDLQMRIEAGTARDAAGNYAEEYDVPGTLSVAIPNLPLAAGWMILLTPAAGWLVLRRRKK